MKKVNGALPEKMELEFEGIYPRGVFVTKQPGPKGAKKKYALIAEDGRIKIRGFELVRRDWSAMAKNTQKSVLEAILKEGSKEKAVKIVRDAIEQLKGGKVPLAELAIVTQIKKPLDKYEIISPEVEAAKKAVKKGKKEIGMGSIVSYVITKKGKSISDKAELLEYASDYDAAYYIDHQILPAVLKILKELGYDAEDLKTKGTQKNMSEFFG
ncbi:DNA polymerase PolB subunit 2 [Candidatus Gugararchaeum adminiculabundum]|nr:DNA polymerase PolB subunit 2 [Candidatus Gugararchaeum adminiculabundum]